MFAVPVVAALFACTTQSPELTVSRSISGAIGAGQSKTVWMTLAPGEVAHVALHQHEIKLAIEAQGIRVDSTDWGTESVYIAAGDAPRIQILISADPHQSMQGRFELRLLAIRPALPKDSLAIRAGNLESGGRSALDQARRTFDAGAN